MMTVAGVKSSFQAASYYDKDDYYSEKGQSPSHWYGAGAEALGLSGSVDRDVFKEMLDGNLPSGDRIGMEKNGEWVHAPGYDATFSAPKTVSIMALAAGDNRLVNVHSEAVKEALDFIQERVAGCRIRTSEGIEDQKTNNIIAASFLHSTSRNNDPQLHTHNVILNLTKDANGQWRSLDARELFNIHHEANKVYEQTLAQKILELGYNIARTKNGFEIDGVPENVIAANSSRSNAVEAWLEAKGYDRDTADTKLKQKAALATRPPKEIGVDREALKEHWQQKAAELGCDLREMLPRESSRRSPEKVAENAKENASKSVDLAIRHLAERDSRFTCTDLEDRAMKQASGFNATLTDIRAAIKSNEQLKACIKNTEKGAVAGYTTLSAIKAERAILAIERSGRDSVEPIASSRSALDYIKKADAESEYGFNNGQIEATHTIVTSVNSVVALQGLAGTSKTNSVIKTSAELAQMSGYQVVGMAPTSNAAAELSSGGGIKDTQTVDKFLGSLHGKTVDNEQKKLWVVDEASMLSAEKMTKLLRAAENHGAKVLLVGDIKQLGSIEAGAAFRQMQESGMQVTKLDEIVRQQNKDTLAGVYSSVEGNIKEAMEHIERGGKIVEIADAGERRREMAAQYLNTEKDMRDKTLVLDSTRKGRAELNSLIREGLKAEGALSGADKLTDRLDNKDLTKVEKLSVNSYEAGEVVRFDKDIKSLGVEKGGYYSVDSVNYSTGAVTLKNGAGEQIKWLPERMASAHASVYKQESVNLAIGESIVWRDNNADLGLRNGQTLKITELNGSSMIVQDNAGKNFEINVSTEKGKHFDHAYCSTVYSSQGRTAENVIANLAKEDKALLSQQQWYVTISRAKQGVTIFTDDRKGVTKNIQEKTGQKETALERV